VQKSGLSVDLAKLSRLTIFAPSNSALAAAKSIRDIRLNRRQLAYYIVSELITVDTFYGFVQQENVPNVYPTFAGKLNKIGIVWRQNRWHLTSGGHDSVPLAPYASLINTYVNSNITSDSVDLVASSFVTILIYGIDDLLRPNLGICEKVTMDYQRVSMMPARPYTHAQ
jgi:hypothetical protein